MKRVLKIMLTIVLFIFIAIQFYQPALNVDKGQVYITDFTQVYKMPVEVKAMLQTSCYDCHSNNTNYVWYDYIQPARALVENHIKNAKQDLNFNEWGTYSNRKQERLLNSIKEQIETKQMPLSSYTIMHENAKLNDEQIKVLTNWLKEQD
ncbi:heme-binding domain-containing protein [Flavobacterium sp. HSC-61S13]|uniref:heme-binding domain-containing protein n=1 Tax=Flavobacterium sp. HSC-61S13 TaxID=2910963 RepID=UPI00209E32ED|nr:heme-binding domain-containing protein [Flavobacterium sp. HSC-61S13]MCP1994460.1 cytochrome c553 [Flavobacterium sp. HSC-61S13]